MWDSLRIRLLAAGICLIATSHPATPATIRVPGDSEFIQEALDQAGSGDTILVAPGVYSSPGNWDLDFNGKSVLLLSEAGPAATVIDGQESAPQAFVCTSREPPQAAVDGFTISRFKNGGGGAILVNQASPTFAHCRLTANRGTIGAAVLVFYGSPTFTDCEVTRRRSGAERSAPSGTPASSSPGVSSSRTRRPRARHSTSRTPRRRSPTARSAQTAQATSGVGSACPPTTPPPDRDRTVDPLGQLRGERRSGDLHRLVCPAHAGLLRDRSGRGGRPRHRGVPRPAGLRRSALLRGGRPPRRLRRAGPRGRSERPAGPRELAERPGEPHDGLHAR
jgi:hypothetical protein